MKKSVLMLGVAALLAGCATGSPDVISRESAQRTQTISDGEVVSVREVTLDGTQSGIGTAAGAVVGGLAGSSVGGRRDSIAGGVLGAVAGGVVGNVIERGTTKEQALEIIVRRPNGERVVIVQTKGADTFAPGDRVMLITDRGRTRVVRAR